MELICFKNNQLTLYYQADRRLVRALWDGFLSGEEFRASALACTQVLQERAPLYWLADNRKLKAIREKDQEWFMQHIAPRMAACSLVKMATLISEDIFNQMAVETLHTLGTPVMRFEARFFHQEEQALQWLTASHEAT